MVDLRQQHPTPEQLQQFGLGHLSAADAAAVERHVAKCDACCEMVRGVDDSLLDRLRGSDTSPAEFETATSLEPGIPQDEAGVPTALNNHPRYQIVERLGRGGMGVVYRAEHRIMKRSVALKVIHPRLIERPEAIARFEQEVRTAARLNHENVVTAHDADQVEGYHFLVMEHVEGESLDRLIHREGKLPVERACRFARQAALGLEAARQQQMVHRDIKPSNLMVTPDDRVKILDFGLARLARQEPDLASTGVTSAGVVLGTPDYMAPEQARNSSDVDIRADIYSLGCTLYHALAGEVPFPAGSIIETLAAHLERDPEPLGEIRDDVPAELAEVVCRMMAKDPADRFQAPSEVAAALTPFAEGRPLASPVAAVATTKPRRNLWLAGGALAAGLAVLSLLALFRDGEPDKLSLLDDDFDGPKLADTWREIEGTKPHVQDGQLVMEPTNNESWYMEDRGMMVFTEIEGDFMATAHVSAGNRFGNGPPDQEYNVAGLIARNGSAASENWFMIAIGREKKRLVTKAEPTENSFSNPEFEDASTSEGELRLARLGNDFYLLSKLAGDRWDSRRVNRFTLHDAPRTMQVGLAAGAYESADLRAEFDYIRFRTPSSESDLYKD